MGCVPDGTLDRWYPPITTHILSLLGQNFIHRIATF